MFANSAMISSVSMGWEWICGSDLLDVTQHCIYARGPYIITDF